MSVKATQVFINGELRNIEWNNFTAQANIMLKALENVEIFSREDFEKLKSLHKKEQEKANKAA